MNHLTLTRKILLQLLFILSFAMLVGVFAFSYLIHLKDRFFYIGNEVIPIMESFSGLQSAFLSKGIAFGDFKIGENTEGEKGWNKSDSEIAQQIEVLKNARVKTPSIAYFLSENQIKRFIEINNELNSSKQKYIAEIALQDEKQKSEEATHIHLLIEEGSIAVQNLKSGVSALLHHTLRHVSEDSQLGIRRVGGFLALTFAVGLFVGWVFSIFLKRSIGSIAAAAQKISSGKFDERISIETQDEVGRLAGAINDMAAHLQGMYSSLESRVAERTTELMQSEEKYRSLIDNSLIGVFSTTVKGEILYVNSVMASMFGYDSVEEFIKSGAISHYKNPDERARLIDELKHAGFVSNFELHLLKKNKEPMIVLINATLVGEILNGMMLDITAHRQHEIRIRELNELRNKFIQIVSHQLRTPLNSIRWNLETLLSDGLGALKPEQKEFVRLTYEADVEVVRRIHDLLTAMDIEDGRITLNRTEISLESLWSSTMIEWKKKCLVKELRCEYERIKTELPIISLDAEKMREVFEKLADNASTYTPNKGVISVKFIKMDGRIRFEIRDNGIGIPDAEQKYIFKPFYRASNAATMKPDASGLGLAIAKSFVEQHGGSIGFESKEGSGSLFWFELPA